MGGSSLGAGENNLFIGPMISADGDTALTAVNPCDPLTSIINDVVLFFLSFG